MSRPRTPTAILELRGAYRKNPQRRRDRGGEPLITTPLGDPPAGLSDSEQAVWREMASIGHWLTGADRFLLEIAVSLVARHRAGELEGPATSKLIAALRNLGFAPVDRGRLGY
jgi:hypothetical protein